MNIFKRYYNYLKTRSEHRAVIKQLNELSDRELRDIGIPRGSIEVLVWMPEDKLKSGAEALDKE